MNAMSAMHVTACAFALLLAACSGSTVAAPVDAGSNLESAPDPTSECGQSCSASGKYCVMLSQGNHQCRSIPSVCSADVTCACIFPEAKRNLACNVTPSCEDRKDVTVLCTQD